MNIESSMKIAHSHQIKEYDTNNINNKKEKLLKKCTLGKSPIIHTNINEQIEQITPIISSPTSFNSLITADEEYKWYDDENKQKDK